MLARQSCRRATEAVVYDEDGAPDGESGTADSSPRPSIPASRQVQTSPRSTSCARSTVRAQRSIVDGAASGTGPAPEGAPVIDPADPQDEWNRCGGEYELAVELDDPDEARVDAAVRELSRLAGVEPVAGGHALRLPDGARVVCTHQVFGTEDSGSVWIVLGLPLGSLARVDPRVGSFPISELGASWRPSLDAWLASLAMRLFDVVPFSLALVGFHAYADSDLSDDDLDAVPPNEHAHVGIIHVTDRPAYFPAKV